MAVMHLPPFHTMAIFSQMIFPLFGCTTVALYPPVVESSESLPTLPTPDNILDHIQRTKSNSLMTTPTLLQIWGQDQQAVDILSALQFVVRFYPVSLDQQTKI
jgi:acyl-coenzyme A synthetase/AMP-(fatty) acid ligase